MNAALIRELFDYNYKTHRRVWEECILPLTGKQFKQHHDFSIGSVCAHVVHMMIVEFWWVSRLQGKLPQELIPIIKQQMEPLGERRELRIFLDEVERQVRAFVSKLTDADLERIYEYPGPGDRTYRHTWAQILVQVYGHSIDHRAQMLAMIHKLGGQTIPQDYIMYLWNRDAENLAG